MNRKLVTLTLAASLVACGRTDLSEEFAPTMKEPTKVEQREQPLYVFKDAPCPAVGVESDLNVTDSGERLVLVKTQPQIECSGAGGDYLVGQEIDSSRDVFVGTHACWFLPRQLADGRAFFFGVARVAQTAALFHAPKDWCITRLDGMSELSSDSTVRAWALYPDEKAARAALGALKKAP